MLETGGDPVKRPAGFRNRTNNRRNSRDRLDKLNIFGGENEEKLGNSLNVSGGVPEWEVGVGKKGGNESSMPGRIEMNGCGNSEAIRLMNERWVAALHSQNDPSLDDADRPVVYSSSEGGSVWGSSKLAYQASVMDFLSEVGHAIRRANTNKASARVSSF